MRLDAEIARRLLKIRTVAAIAGEGKMGHRLGRHNRPRGDQQIVQAFFRNQPAHLSHHQPVERNLIAAAKRFPLSVSEGGAFDIHAVINDVKALLGKQVARGEVSIAVTAHRDYSGDGSVDHAGYF